MTKPQPQKGEFLCLPLKALQNAETLHCNVSVRRKIVSLGKPKPALVIPAKEKSGFDRTPKSEFPVPRNDKKIVSSGNAKPVRIQTNQVFPVLGGGAGFGFSKDTILLLPGLTAFMT